MKKVLFVFFGMVISYSGFAEYATSPINGGAVIFTAKEGAIVKKGEVLYKIKDWWFKNEIERAKIDIELSKAKVDDLKTDISRAKKLYDKKAISLAAYENIVLGYYKAEYALIKSKLELKRKKSTLEDYVGKAPYDCKVIKNLINDYSGTQYGTKIMEIQPLSKATPKEKDNSGKTPLLHTSYIQGDLIAWMAEEGQTIKKGDIFIKFDTVDIDLIIESLKYTIKEAEECVKDSKTDIERARTLAFNENHAISTKAYEDVLYENQVCSLSLKKLNLKLAYYKELRKFYEIPAPYDIKILKRTVSVNSGLKYGNTIMEVQKL